jgi:hypothetical protein
MPWKGFILFKSAKCLGGLLYLNRQFFLEIWEIFCFHFVEHITYPFGFQIFSFYNAHDSQIWCFFFPQKKEKYYFIEKKETLTLAKELRVISQLLETKINIFDF